MSSVDARCTFMQGYKHAPAATKKRIERFAGYCQSNNCRPPNIGDPRTSHSGNAGEACCTDVPADYDMHLHLHNMLLSYYSSILYCRPWL